MSNAENNPFVLPGMGQNNADLAGNPLFAGLEMMRRTWSSLAGANGLAQSLPMSPMLNIEDLDKRVAELKSVESWLSLNLSMLSSTIQGMEVQRATLTTLRSFVDAASHVPGTPEDGRSPLEIVLGIRAPASEKTATRRTPTNDAASGRSARDSATTGRAVPERAANDAFSAASAGWPGGDAAGAAGEQVKQASQAWWDMMQQQFQQLATATAASVPGQSATGGPAGPSAVTPAADGPRSTGKPREPGPKPRTRSAAVKKPATVAKRSTKTATAAAKPRVRKN